MADMPPTRLRELTIALPDGSVSALLVEPEAALACLVLAHGAGAGMRHPFLEGLASDLAALKVATLRYQFPFMERASRRPDAPAVAQATVRAAMSEAARLMPGLPLVAGGRSFGGRMTSQAQAQSPLPAVRGLVFLAFPLHPAGRPSAARARHLESIDIPMLFLQGSRDALAALDHLRPVLDGLGPGAKLHLVDEADHAFHVPARSGRRDAEVRQELAAAIRAWVDATVAE